MDKVFVDYRRQSVNNVDRSETKCLWIMRWDCVMSLRSGTVHVSGHRYGPDCPALTVANVEI